VTTAEQADAADQTFCRDRIERRLAQLASRHACAPASLGMASRAGDRVGDRIERRREGAPVSRHAPLHLSGRIS
jgi:hypothetical protein